MILVVSFNVGRAASFNMDAGVYINYTPPGGVYLKRAWPRKVYGGLY